VSTLSGKTALVTDGAHSIGRATVLALARAGAQVLIHYWQSDSEAAAVLSEVRATGGIAEKVCADLGTPDGAHVLATQVKALIGERLDIPIANVGTSRSTSFGTTVQEFDRLLVRNVRAPYFLVQQLLPTIQRGSRIVFVSSLQARAMRRPLSAYAAARGGIATLIRHLAAVLAPQGIRVKELSPGAMNSDDLPASSMTGPADDETASVSVLLRTEEPDDVANVIVAIAC
jgi:3-oxoacyl-[acyl-carrier protein] reductase